MHLGNPSGGFFSTNVPSFSPTLNLIQINDSIILYKNGVTRCHIVHAVFIYFRVPEVQPTFRRDYATLYGNAKTKILDYLHEIA